MLKRAEFGQNQAALARQIDSGAKPRLLAILKDFTGWERGADWDDLEFQLSHGNEIAKIAIVGEPDWEPQALAFAGVGFRRAPVRYFPSEQLAEARTWLAE
jgi:hypothetical protein